MNKRFLLIILFILLAYVAVTACLGFDINKKARAYVAGRMSQVLYMDVFPERIRFGLINNITIDNLHICRSDSRFIFSGIFDKVIIKYRFRDLILGRFDSPRIVAINRGSLRWHDQATGITIKKDNVYGSAGSFDIKGYEVRLVSGQSYLRGKVNPSKDTFDLDLNFSSMFYSSGQVLEDSQNIKQSKDFFLNVNGRLTKQISQAAGCDLFFEAENEYLTVAFNLKGNLQKSRIKGRFNLLNRVIRPFRGELSIGRTIVLSLDDGSEDPQLRLSAKLLKPDFELGIKLNHFNFKALDIITRLDLSGKLKRTKQGFLVVEGSLNSQGSVLDYRPFGELDCRYRLQSNTLEILSLSLGENLFLSGCISLEFPYSLDLVLAVAAESLDDLEPVFCLDENIFAARQIKADFRLSGPLANPEVKGRFESKNGFLTKLGNYDSMNVNLNGNAKFLTIHESRIYRGKGSFTVDGEINFEKKNIFEDIKVTAKSGILVWSGWEVSREKAGHEVRLGRDIGEDFRINFKTYLDEKTNSYHTGEHEVELEYMLSNEKSFKMRMKEDENFLGLEHKIKF